MPATSPESNARMEQRIRRAKRICHVKLGEGGSLASECINDGKLYIGYFTGAKTLALLNRKGEDKWREIRELVESEGDYPEKKSLTAAVNQVREVVDDDGSTLWFTFHASKLYWTFIVPETPLELFREDHGTIRRTIGWRCHDLTGMQIDEGQVTTRISQVRAYRRTVRVYDDRADGFGVEFNPVEYLRNKVLGVPQPSEVEARKAQQELEQIAERLIIRLTDTEFENFVDLIFVGDGWQRVTEVGGQMADIDGQYEHATSGATAKVQCKSATSVERLNESPLMNDPAGSSTWIYWVYHTADATFESDVAARFGENPRAQCRCWYPFPHNDSAGRFYLINRHRLAELAVRKGLIGWLRHKAC